jgi:hypothetical protein
MDMFWIIPCTIGGFIFIRVLYGAIARKIGEPIDGIIITDRPSAQRKREPMPKVPLRA